MEHAFRMTPARMTPAESARQKPEPVPAAIFAPDTILDSTYRILQMLGQGGMGEVYLAAHERLPGFFAVKAMQPGLVGHAESVSRFRREVEILAGIRHPNVVQVFDFNVSPQGVPYLVMELIEGQDLDAALQQGQELSPADAMSIVRQIASALDAAHAVGVVHRDLKPANVILVPAPGQAPIVKVIDFGISISGSSHRITTESRVVGTPEYMSPEQALGQRDEIDGRSDQFALAALAHTLLAKRPPFSGDTPLSTLSAIVHGAPEALGPHVSWPAGEVQEVLCKGMARARDDRYPSVLDMADALEAALARSGALAEPARSCPSLAGKASPSGRVPVLGLLVGRTPGGARNTPITAATMKVARLAREDAATPAPGPRRPSSRSLSLVTLLALGAALAAARTVRPNQFHRGVTTASEAIQEGWVMASAMLDRLPSLGQAAAAVH